MYGQHTPSISQTIFELSVANVGANVEDFQQTSVGGVCWNYFFHDQLASNRMPQLISDGITAPGGANANPPINVPWERVSSSARKLVGESK